MEQHKHSAEAGPGLRQRSVQESARGERLCCKMEAGLSQTVTATTLKKQSAVRSKSMQLLSHYDWKCLVAYVQ